MSQRPQREQHDHDGDKSFTSAVANFKSQVDDVIAWCNCKEDEINQRPSEGELREAPLNQVLGEYSRHEKFMTEICEYCHTIMKCKEEGQELRDRDETPNEEDLDEIGIHMDLLLVHYDKLKIITTDRLHNLQRIVDERQRSQIERLEKWLSSMELKLSTTDNIGPDSEALQRQMIEIDELKRELEQKQDFLNIVSQVIMFDDIDLGTQELRSRSYESLENRLDLMNSRWIKICQSVNERCERLRKADAIWKVLQLEGPQMTTWLCKIQLNFNELSDAIRNIIDPKSEAAFISKLASRSERLESEMKVKQTFYTSLESRVRAEIERFDDPCSMFVIELEKRLEDMQDNWNSIMRQKRMIDYSLQALSNPDTIVNNTPRPIIPVPEPITSTQPVNRRLENGSAALRPDRINEQANNELMTNSSSTGNDDLDSSPQLNDSLSDTRVFENSSSSQDTRSLVFGESINQNHQHQHHQNHHQQHHQNQQILHQGHHNHHTNSLLSSHDELSSATNLTSSQPGNMYPANNDDTNYLDLDFKELDHDHAHAHDHETHSCRVEEWKHSLESFSSWLREVEIALGVDGSVSFERTWSRLDLREQLTLLQETEGKIISTCQDEFDCLFLQGQQIIEDLMPEIGENEYEANLKDILTDIKLRYDTVKRYLDDRKHELADKNRWRGLLTKMQDTCSHLIGQMAKVTPDTEIGVDLITLAQQQDQLMRQMEKLETNSDMQSCTQEAKLFLNVHDTLQQMYGQAQHMPSMGPTVALTTRTQHQTIDFKDIWLSFKEHKDDIENHLDRLTLHNSELSQLIQDRLDRLDEVHKEMHALQQCIQDLATKLQMAEILKSNWVSLENLAIEQLSEQLEDLKIYRERLLEVESVHKEMNSIVDWMDEFSAPLSQSNLNRIDELNSIWDFIQSSVEERQKMIEQAFDEQSGSEQKFLVQTVADLPKWERRVATSKVPYYVEHEFGKTYWDHPKFTGILESMNECKQYVFSVYRTAMKLRIVQRQLGIDKLMLEQLKELFNVSDSIALMQQQQQQQQQRTSAANNIAENLDSQSVQTSSIAGNDTHVGIEQIILLLKAIYEKIQVTETPTLDVPLAIDLTLNWLLNLYDSTRTGQVSLLSLKVGLTLICCATREQKYTYMFELVSSASSGTVDAKRLGTLFEICMRIPTYLGEGESFVGSDLIETSIRNCFGMSKFNPQHPNCIDLNDYLNWLKTEPQFIIWLPVLHRFLISETTIHPYKCKLCGTDPIVGLRYRCLKCFKFNICQKCFLTGRHVFEHHEPAKHPMQEYCSKTSSGENVRDFTRIVRNKLHLRKTAH